MKVSASQKKILKALKKLKKATKEAYGYTFAARSGALPSDLIREGIPSRSLWRSVLALQKRGLVTLIEFPDFTEIKLN